MSIQLENTIEIERPIEEVFDYLTSPEKLGQWVSSLRGAQVLDGGPIREGSRLGVVERHLGREWAWELTVTEHRPPEQFALTVNSGPFPGKMAVSLETTDGGTRVTLAQEAEPGGLLKLAQPIIVRLNRSQTEGDLKRLKSILEAKPEPVQGGASR